MGNACFVASVYICFVEVFFWILSKYHKISQPEHSGYEILSTIIFNPFMPEHYLTSVVWTHHIFENNFGMKDKFANKVKESCE